MEKICDIDKVLLDNALKKTPECIGPKEQVFRCPLCFHIHPIKDSYQKMPSQSRLKCLNCNFVVWIPCKKLNECLILARFITTKIKKKWWSKIEKEGFWLPE